jgi:dihydroorotase-like cyclic amidohydrolase
MAHPPQGNDKNMEPTYDLVIKNVRVVRPQGDAVQEADIAIRDGKFTKISGTISPEEAKKTYDGKGRLAFPGVVDAHMHAGIYAPLAEDAVSESRAAAQGGVTSSLNYFRTGRYYLNKGGPYRKFFPEVLKISAGKFHVDYAYHLAPMDRTHVAEIPSLIQKHGVCSFKIRQPARLPDDRAGRALRLRPLRIHHARDTGRARALPREGGADQLVAALRDGGNNDCLYKANGVQ